VSICSVKSHALVSLLLLSLLWYTVQHNADLLRYSCACTVTTFIAHALMWPNCDIHNARNCAAPVRWSFSYVLQALAGRHYNEQLHGLLTAAGSTVYLVEGAHRTLVLHEVSSTARYQTWSADRRLQQVSTDWLTNMYCILRQVTLVICPWPAFCCRCILSYSPASVVHDAKNVAPPTSPMLYALFHVHPPPLPSHTHPHPHLPPPPPTTTTTHAHTGQQCGQPRGPMPSCASHPYPRSLAAPYLFNAVLLPLNKRPTHHPSL
jgi:hypothetical protein